MTDLDTARQALDQFLAAVRSRKKTQSLVLTTTAFQERGRDGGDGAARLYDVTVGCRAERGRSVVIGKKVAAEIWRTSTAYRPGGAEKTRQPLMVHLVKVEDAWLIDDAELNKWLKGRAQMRQAEDPGAPKMPVGFSSWLAEVVSKKPTRVEVESNDPIVQIKSLSEAGITLRPTMIKKLNGTKTLRVQFLLEGPGLGKRSPLYWGEFRKIGQSWEVSSWS